MLTALFDTTRIVELSSRGIHNTTNFKDAVQSDLRMCTKEPSFYLQTVYLGFYFILCSCKA